MRQFSFISYFPKKFFSYIIVCRKSMWDSLLKFNSQYILHINIQMLSSRIIRFNIQKKPYGKLIFTPRSSSPRAASVSRYPSHSYVDYGIDSTWWQISQVPLERARGGKTLFVPYYESGNIWHKSSCLLPANFLPTSYQLPRFY